MTGVEVLCGLDCDEWSAGDDVEPTTELPRFRSEITGGVLGRLIGMIFAVPTLLSNAADAGGTTPTSATKGRFEVDFFDIIIISDFGGAVEKSEGDEGVLKKVFKN